jgi:hypothetical protein
MDLTDAEINDLVTMIDISGDGQIDLAEFEGFAKAELEMMHLESVLGDPAGGDGQQSNDLAKATHRGTRFHRTASVQADLKLQGDIEMLSEAATKIRADLKSNAKIKGVIQSWWDALRQLSHDEREEMDALKGKRMKRNERRNSIQFLQENQYVLHDGISEKQFYTLMQSIHRMLDPDGDAVEKEAMHLDWLNDKTDGEERMDFGKFYDSMFELCDLWVEGLSVDKYCGLLEKCAKGSVKAEKGAMEQQRKNAAEMARLERSGKLGAIQAADAAAKAAAVAYAAAFGDENGGCAAENGGCAAALVMANEVLKELNRLKMLEGERARAAQAAAAKEAAAKAALVALEAVSSLSALLGQAGEIAALLGLMDKTARNEAVMAIGAGKIQVENLAVETGANMENEMALLEKEETLEEVADIAKFAYLTTVRAGTGDFKQAQLAARNASNEAVDSIIRKMSKPKVQVAAPTEHQKMDIEVKEAPKTRELVIPDVKPRKVSEPKLPVVPSDAPVMQVPFILLLRTAIISHRHLSL